MLHPDKSHLAADYFLFYKKALDIIVRYCDNDEKQNREVGNDKIDYKPENNLNKSSQNVVQKNIEKMSSTDFHNKFNQLFEENMAENSDVFAQATAQLSESIALVGGLRSSRVRFASTDYQTNGAASGDVSYSATSPVLGLTYFATDRWNIYANFGRGFETPTLSEVAYKTSSILHG
jgi:outer membrane receptor protein involved in Fe transport